MLTVDYKKINYQRLQKRESPYNYMIEQGNNTIGNQLKLQYLELCAEAAGNERIIEEFVRNLFDIVEADSEDSKLRIMTMCIREILREKKEDSRVEKVTLRVFVELLRAIVRVDCRYGGGEVGALMGDLDVRELAIKAFTEDQEGNQTVKQLKKVLIRMNSSQFITKVHKIALPPLLSSTKPINFIGTIKFLSNILFYLPFVDKKESTIDQKRLSVIVDDHFLAFIREKVKAVNGFQLKMFLDACMDYQAINLELKIEIKNRGYELAWLAIVRAFQIDNLEKKLASLACLDYLIEIIREKSSASTQLISSRSLTQLMRSILEPRNHEQVLNRSLNFICYWLMTVDQKKLLEDVLKQWFDNLILKSDSRTSNIFLNTWHKLILNLNQLGQMQLGVIYGQASKLYEIFFKIRSKNEDEMKVARVLGPLINKQFKPFELHEKMTFNFLKMIWDQKHLLLENLQFLIDQELKTCVISAINPNLNLYLLEQVMNQLFNLVSTNNLLNDDTIVQRIQAQVTQIYTFISAFLFSLSTDSNPGNQLFKGRAIQMRQTGITILRDKQCLNNLIICHNSNNSGQLRQFLQMMTLIIKEINDQEFQSQQLEIIRRKVDNSDQFFIAWIKDRLNSIKNSVLRASVMTKMFSEPSLYHEITLQGLETLLHILLSYDAAKNTKIQFALTLLKQLKPTLIKKSIQLILRSLWNKNELIEQQILKDLYSIITGIKLVDWIEIFIYSELIKISQEIYGSVDVGLGDRVVGENLANQRKISVKVCIVGLENLEKMVQCMDSLPLWKFKVQHLYPILNSASQGQPLIESILSIKYNNFQTKKEDIHSSLAFLSHKYPSQAIQDRFFTQNSVQMTVNLHSKSYVLLKNLNEGTLHHIIHKLYGNGMVISLNLVEICTRGQWKGLLKYFDKVSDRKINLEQMLRQQAFCLIDKCIKLLLEQQVSSKTERLVIQLGQFIQEIDKEKQLTLKQANLNYSHRKIFSNEKYFLEKALNLLQVSTPFNSGIRKNDKEMVCVPQIAFQFLNRLIATKQLQNTMVRGMESWIKADPETFPYLLCFGFQVLWLVLKDPSIMVSFIQSAKFNEVFEVVMQCAAILNDKKKFRQETVGIHVNIALTGLKIFNKVIRLSLIVSKNLAILFITRQPSDLLSITQTKKNIEALKTTQSFQKLMNEDSEVAETLAVANLYKGGPLNFKIDGKTMIKCILIIYDVMEQFNNNVDEANVFLLFYEASRLNCWMIVHAGQDEQAEMITCLTKNLNSECSELSLICKSLLFIYMNLDSANNCTKILAALFQILHSASSKSPTFYDLLSQCFTFCESQQLIEKTTQTFFSILIDLKPAKVTEINESLTGILEIIRRNAYKLSRDACEAFLQLMVSNYLFYSNDQIKALHYKERESVYKSIQACLGEHSDISSEELFIMLKQEIKKANSVQDDIKDNRMGVGLQNLGNICYMNSLLQLLHSIKPFVSELCSIHSEFPLLLGLQKLFINLTESMKKSISPQEFLFCFEPPIDVGLQEDTTEFMIGFLDKLQCGETSGKFKGLANNLFKGETISNFVCEECKKGKQKVQDFYLYNLAIENENKHFKDLQQCLQNAKIPEVIYDVNCQGCKKQTKFTKNMRLKTVPPYFLIHLRRLIFDYRNPYVKSKVHSRLTFPDSIVINKQKLKLKGVITHSGTGEHGHYFTSIREADGWIVYNDSKVYPLPHNGKEDLWYGSVEGMEDNLYSTNAYVLLYQKQNKNNLESRMKLPEVANALKDILKSNRAIMTKQLLFGRDHRTDFINFAFNVAKLPNSKDSLTKIYELLALISYNQGMASTTSPTEYFSNIKLQSSPSLEALIETLFEYKEHNNRFFFHKNVQLRQFFNTFMAKVFQDCLKQISQGKCKLALVYACQIVRNCAGIIKEQQNFVNSSQYIKFVAFLIRKFSRSQEFLARFYQSSIIPELLNLFKARRVQIQMNYITTQIQLMEPFLELLISFLMIIKNTDESHNILYFNQYQESFLFVKNFFSGEGSLIELAFMSNSNFSYCELLFNLLELAKEPAFGGLLMDILGIYLKDVNAIDGKTSKNLCYIIWFVEQNYYGSSQLAKRSFCQAVLGMIFPHSPQQLTQASPLHQSRSSSLKQRNYKYITNKMGQSFIQVTSQLLLECLNDPKIKLKKVPILINFFKFLMDLIKQSPTYLDYFSNLCAPIGLYGDFYVFFMACLEDINKKMELGLTVDSGQDERKDLKIIIDAYRAVFSQRKSQNEAVLCGVSFKAPLTILESFINELFVFVQEHQNYWTDYSSNGKSALFQYVDGDFRIRPEYSRNEELAKILKPIESETIEEEGMTLARVTTGQSQRDIQEVISIRNSTVRRKLVFTNLKQDPSLFLVKIYGENMKNNIIELALSLSPNQNQEIWVQKKKLSHQWGKMRISVNGVDCEINRMESMENTEGMAAERALHSMGSLNSESMM